MNEYRMAVPATVFFTVYAESDEQAKAIGAQVVANAAFGEYHTDIWPCHDEFHATASVDFEGEATIDDCEPCLPDDEQRATNAVPREGQRLEELRQELRAERISYGELAELQSLASHIDPSDTELLEAAGVPEGRTAIAATKTRILIFVEGGCVTGVSATTPDIEVGIVDHDDDAPEGDERNQEYDDACDNVETTHPFNVY